jgi:phosphatidylserine decarboxylase
MIKFGSRTELYVPADAPVDVAVRVGDTVRGAETVLLRYRT